MTSRAGTALFLAMAALFLIAYGGQSPQRGPGGRELFYASLDGKLMVVSLKPAGDSLEPSSPRELFPAPPTEESRSAFDVSPDGRRILVRAQPQQAAPPLTV